MDEEDINKQDFALSNNKKEKHSNKNKFQGKDNFLEF